MSKHTISAVVVPFVLWTSPLRASDTDAILEKNPAISSSLREYEANVSKVEKDRAKALLSLNDRLISELVRAKSSSLKAEKLDAAVALDKKVKELTEMNIMLKAVTESKKTSTPVVPPSPSAQSQSTLAGQSITANASGIVKLAILRSTLTEEQKTILNGWTEGKLVLLSPHNGQNRIFYYSNGVLLSNDTLGASDAFTSGNFKAGVLTFGYWSFSLSTITNTGVELKWGQNVQKNNPRFVARAEIDAARLPEKEAPKSGPKEGTTQPTESDSDNTVFGRRVK